MTQFAHLELIINQYFNLVNEINSMIEAEEYEAVNEKIEYKNKLISKIFLTKKTVTLTKEEEQKLELMEQKIKKEDQKTIDYINKLREEVGEELRKTNKKVKVNSAYDVPPEQNQGVFINISEL